MRDNSAQSSARPSGVEAAAEAPPLHAGPQRSSVQAAGNAAVDRIVAEVDLCVYVSSADRTRLSMDDLHNQRFGHSFLRYRPRAGIEGHTQPTTFGFYPDDTPKSNPLRSFVAGGVEEPEPYSDDAAGWMTYELAAPQVKALFAYKDAHRNAPYSVYFYNCTTFAEGAIEAAGQSVPGAGPLSSSVLPSKVRAGMGILEGLAPPIGAAAVEMEESIAMPNKVYDGILEREKKHDPHAHTEPLNEGERQTTGSS